MPAKDVKAYVKRNKNDAADAERICEAVRRPTMRFVQIKPVEQQGRLMLHRARDLLTPGSGQCFAGAYGGARHCGCARARSSLKELLKIIASEEDARMPVDAHASLVVLAAGLQALQTMIGSIERRIIAQHRSDEASKRLRSIPGIGIAGATAIAATVPDPKVFRSGRDFAAWIPTMNPRHFSMRRVLRSRWECASSARSGRLVTLRCAFSRVREAEPSGVARNAGRAVGHRQRRRCGILFGLIDGGGCWAPADSFFAKFAGGRDAPEVRGQLLPPPIARSRAGGSLPFAARFPACARRSRARRGACWPSGWTAAAVMRNSFWFNRRRWGRRAPADSFFAKFAGGRDV